ncbi:thioredoxin-like protein [Lasiosphaeria ovina]|uniref:Thioredoxin-like protein n=1 Tax=Lasiosphaeria ovina TaxID=92902 RepID=A0AAE0NFH8_9PEZI|nr:thioredoxin-like protein [Lasiosphaeria ovina]
MAELIPAKPFRLGSEAPTFTAETTIGTIDFTEYTKGFWSVLFCYPKDFTPVSTTELAVLTKLVDEFSRRNVKVLALSTGESLDTHKKWIKDVEEITGGVVSFPLISDASGTIAQKFNVLESEDLEDIGSQLSNQGHAFHTRSVFIISPQHRFRAMFNYPISVGINTSEIIRVIDCLQTASLVGVRTPANWVPGNPVIIHPNMSDEDAEKKFPKYQTVKPYLRFTPLEPEHTSIQVALGDEPQGVSQEPPHSS